jgi:hypothetical protein
MAAAVRSRPFRLAVLTIITICAIVIPLSWFFEPVRVALVRPMIWFVAIVAAVLFLRFVFDWRLQQGVWALNTEMQGPNYPFTFRWISFRDPQWGVFGSRMGPRSLIVARLVVFAEMTLSCYVARTHPDVLLLAFVAFVLSIIMWMVPAGLDEAALQERAKQRR